MNKRLVVSLCVAVSIIGMYTTGYAAYTDRLMMNTYINGKNYSSLTAEEAKEKLLNDMYPNNEFKVHLYGKEYEIKPSDFNIIGEDKIDNVISAQNHKLYPKYIFEKTSIWIKDANGLEEIYTKLLDDYDIFNKNDWHGPRNAYVVKNGESLVSIVPEKKGTIPNMRVFKRLMIDHITGGKGDLYLDDYNKLFEQPEVNQYDEKLVAFTKEINKWLAFTVRYNYEGKTKVFATNYINEFLDIDVDNLTYSFDYEGYLDKVVYELDQYYSSAVKSNTLVTTLGDTVEVPAGDFGWKMDTSEARKNIREALDKLESCTLVPTWETQDGPYSLDDVHNYVEVDLSNQKLYLYEDEILKVESNIVSGNMRNHSTPAGTFTFKYKARNQTLRGPNGDGTYYASFVKYWIPFNGGIGMHDASWRGSFGGNIYKYNGSHGCINMPTSKAKEVYGYLDSSYVIYCYWRDN